LNKSSVFYLVLVMGLISTLVFACQSPAQTTLAPTVQPTTQAPLQPIVLKFSSPMPQGDPISIADIRALDKIEKESNGRIKFERYWGGTLIPFPKSVTEIQAGVADLGVCALAVAPSGFDVIKTLIQSMPAVSSAEEMRRINNEVAAKYPELYADFSKYGKPLAASFPGPFEVGIKKSISKWDDVKGMKIKATMTHIDIMNKLGAEGMDIPSTEVYLALSKGTVDGATMTQNQLQSLKFAEVTKFVVPMNLFDPAGMQRMMNLNSWNKLTPDLQKIFNDNAEFWSTEGNKELTKVNEEALTFAKAQNVTFVNLSQAEMDKLYALTDSIIRTKMAALDAKGLNATKIYTEMYDLAKKY
jgi:TRAP-type transport system periplasmic protein